MASTSPLQSDAVKAAAKVRSKISKSTHDRYTWLFISPDSKEDVKPVVERWISDRENLRDVSNTAGISFGDDPWAMIDDFYPILWTRIAGTLEKPFPGRVLVIIGLEYVNRNNGLPILSTKSELFPGEYVVLSGDEELRLSEGGGGTSIFVLLKGS